MAILNIRGHHFTDRNLSQDSIIIDLGAFKGDFSNIISQKFNCAVYAIEASPITFKECFSNNLVKKFNLAICGEDKNIEFYLGNNPEGNSILKSHKDVILGDCVIIKGVTLNSFMSANNIDEIALLKIDIEGAEISLIDSLSDEFLKRLPQITVEFHDFIESLNIENDVIRIKKRLSKLGFAILIFEVPNKDVLFINLELVGMSKLEYYLLSAKTNLNRNIHTYYGLLKALVKKILKIGNE